MPFIHRDLCKIDNNNCDTERCRSYILAVITHCPTKVDIVSTSATMSRDVGQCPTIRVWTHPLNGWISVSKCSSKVKSQTIIIWRLQNRVGHTLITLLPADYMYNLHRKFPWHNVNNELSVFNSQGLRLYFWRRWQKELTNVWPFDQFIW